MSLRPRITLRTSGKSKKSPGKFRIWGMGESGGDIFTVNLKKRKAHKLSRITLLDFELTFRFHFGRTENTHHYYDFRISGRLHASQNQLFLVWRRQMTQNNWRIRPNLFWIVLFLEDFVYGSLNILEIEKFEKMWRGAGQTTNWRSV